MLHAERKYYGRIAPNVAGLGLTGTTSAAGLPAATVETLKADEPVGRLLEAVAITAWSHFADPEWARESLGAARFPTGEGRFRDVKLPGSIRTGAPARGTLSVEPRRKLILGKKRDLAPRDPLLERIEERKRQLLRERGPFSDSAKIIRELRERGR